MLLIDLINDLQVPRQQLLHQFHRPALQGLREHCVVGIGEGFLGDLPGLQEERFGSCAFRAHSHSTSQCPLCATGASVQSGTLNFLETSNGPGNRIILYFFQGKKPLFIRL